MEFESIIFLILAPVSFSLASKPTQKKWLKPTRQLTANVLDEWKKKAIFMCVQD